MSNEFSGDGLLESDGERQILASWITHATVIGFIVGPLIGSILYAYLGSMNTFFIFGSFMVFFAVIIKLNFNGDAAEVDEDDTFYQDGSCYRGGDDNQFRFGDDLSSFRNDVTPERNRERDSYCPTD